MSATATAQPPTAAPSLNAPPADLDHLPTQRDLQATGISLPPLTLNLHVYDPVPAQRYVLLNGLQLNNVSSYVQQVIIGVIIVLAVAFDTFAKSRRRRV